MATKRTHRPCLEALEDRLVLSGNSVPALSSLPSAPASLYLDFDGHFEAEWGGHTNVTTPAYDIDGDPATFSGAELDNIEKIWRAVAEDYSPFNLNVTTIAPPSFDNGVGLCVAIGGNSAWAGGTFGGLSYINSFTNSLVNTVYIFSESLGGDPRTIADAAAHEAGHAFGLAHQRLWDGATKLAEYQTGPGDGSAPLMGDSYSATRSLWWYGTTSSATTYQNDMAVIASSTNGFGYRADDHGNSQGTATTLNVSASGAFSAGGVIEQMDDLDYFRFSSPGGAFTFHVTIPTNNNLDPRLELRDADGNLLAAVNPAGSFDVGLTCTLSAGDYFLMVASAGVSSNATAGDYGFNVGQYTISGAAADSAAAFSLGLPWINTRNNVSFATARKLAPDPTGEINFVTDLNTVANVDFYKLKMPAVSDGSVTITMNARDLGSLMPKLSVYNASMKRLGKIIGGAGSAVMLTVTGLKPGAVFYIVADGPKSNAFGKGDYRLNVQVGGFGIEVGGTFSTTSVANVLAAALALPSASQREHDQADSHEILDGQARDSQAPTTQATFAGSFHLQASIKRRVETPLDDGHVLSQEGLTAGSGRRRSSLRRETRLPRKAGLFLGRIGS